MKRVKIGDFYAGEGEPLVVISGPCVIEGEREAMEAAEFLVDLFDELEMPFVFKASYDKANRTSVDSFRGPGLKKGLKILKKVRKAFGVPVLTDVHTVEEAYEAGEVCDVIQIPAFLCRQTDLLVAAGETGAVVNVKKGQFLAPWDMQPVIDKLDCDEILLTDRGTTFGYNNLVSDMRAIPIMKSTGFPIVYDATHSVQLPGGLGSSSGGQREFIEPLSRAAIAAGCHAIFAEAHPRPEKAKSDSASMIAFADLPKLARSWKRISMAMHG